MVPTPYVEKVGDPIKAVVDFLLGLGGRFGAKPVVAMFFIATMAELASSQPDVTKVVIVVCTIVVIALFITRLVEQMNNVGAEKKEK